MKVINQYDEARENIEAISQALPTAEKNKICRVFRTLCAVLWILLSFPLMFLIVPLRLLHPLLRIEFGIQNDRLPIDLVQRWWCRAILGCYGVRVYWQNQQRLKEHGATIALFSHASNLDPLAVQSGVRTFKMIGKKILFMIPLLGWLAGCWGHLAIDRSNRKRAIASLNKAKQKIIKYDRSIAISPEGTRSKSGKLADFKKGPFHMAVQVGLNCTPILLLGAYELNPPNLVCPASGNVVVRVLPRVTVGPDDTHQTVRTRARRVFLEAYKEEVAVDTLTCFQIPFLDVSLLLFSYAVLGCIGYLIYRAVTGF